MNAGRSEHRRVTIGIFAVLILLIIAGIVWASRPGTVEAYAAREDLTISEAVRRLVEAGLAAI
jgi:hypothetical protein